MWNEQKSWEGDTISVGLNWIEIVSPAHDLWLVRYAGYKSCEAGTISVEYADSHKSC